MQSFILDASHFELLRVSGNDAERLLQGQLTCDVSAVADGGFVFGAACNNKGRVIAPFMLFRHGQDFLLLFRSGLASLFLAVLKKFLPFYKCTMGSDDSLVCCGLGGTLASPWLEARGLTPPLPGQTTVNTNGLLARISGDTPQYVLIAQAAELVSPGSVAHDALTQDEGTLWQAATLRNGHFPFAPADSEQYTPQELHYEQKAYVSFTKGCYTGQEIVARMHYRGKIKKQFCRVELAFEPGKQLPSLSLLDDSGAALAECIKLTCLPDGQCLALASLPVELPQSRQSLPSSAGIEANLLPF
jgi:tRNA-modifying protein YgfZ